MIKRHIKWNRLVYQHFFVTIKLFTRGNEEKVKKKHFGKFSFDKIFYYFKYLRDIWFRICADFWTGGKCRVQLRAWWLIKRCGHCDQSPFAVKKPTRKQLKRNNWCIRLRHQYRYTFIKNIFHTITADSWSKDKIGQPLSHECSYSTRGLGPRNVFSTWEDSG